MGKNLVRNNKGLSLIEIIFAVFISGVAILTLNIFATQMDMENKKLSDSSTAIRKNYDFLELMNNPTIWKATVLDISNYNYFSCKLGILPHPNFFGKLDCSKMDNKFRIISSDGSSTIIYDQNERNADGQLVGFTTEGVKCYGFDAVNGSDTCPTHYEITWDLPCVKAGNCKEPSVKVSVKQITKYLTKKALDSERDFNLNINLPQSSDIVPRDTSLMVGINSGEQTLDILKSDYSSDLFNLRLKTVESSSGATVEIKGNKISYKPKANFYGLDKVSYTVEQNLFDKLTKSDGVLWVKVMTPYTWTGDGPAEEVSASGKKWYSIYNKMNWCGEVVNNKCTHFNPDPKKVNDLLTLENLKQASLVFNETCVNCNVLMKALMGNNQIILNGIEIGASFPGEIKQIDNISIEVRRNASNRNSNDPALEFAFVQNGGVFIGANSKANLLIDEVSPYEKSLTIAHQDWSGNSKVKIKSASVTADAYGYFSITGGKFYAPEKITTTGGFSIISDKNAFFNQNGRFTVHPKWDSGNLLDAPGVTFNEFAFNGAGAFEFSIVGSFNVKDFYMYQTGYESQLRGFVADPNAGKIYVSRNIYLHGGGGFMVNGWGSSWNYANIVVNSASDQYIYSNLDLNGNKDRTKVGRLPNLIVDKPSGTLHIKGDLGFTSGMNIIRGGLKFYENEEVAAGDKQTIEFSSAWNTLYIKNTSGNELVLPNLEFSPQCASIVFEANVRVAGDLIQDKMKYNPQCSGYPFGPKTTKIFVEGDVYVKSGTHEYDANGLMSIELTGTRNQRIVGYSDSFYKNNISGITGGVELNTTVEAAKGYLPHLIVNKSAGTVSMEGAIGFVGNFTVVSGEVVASKAFFSFANTNGYEGKVALANGPGASLRIKGLNVQRAIDLSGNTLIVTNGVNFPAPAGGYNNGSVSNGKIELLSGDLFYNDKFDRVESDVNRAQISFVGVQPQTIHANMAADNRYGAYEITINKKAGSGNYGKLAFDCQNSTSSVFVAERLELRNGNIELNNCGFKTSRRLEIVNGNETVNVTNADGTTSTVTYTNGNINRGGSPGVFLYGSLNNNGSITPSVIAGQ